MSADELTGWSLDETARAIRERRVSSREVTEACLRRIERWNPTVNAFLRVFDDSVIAAAERADAAVAAGRPLGPLHGVPLAHKDMYFRTGRA